MTIGIVDSTVIIHLLRGNPNALAWVNSLTTPLDTTPISWLEIMLGAPGKAGKSQSDHEPVYFDVPHP
jgi:predicted nucleic acid-binding protein